MNAAELHRERARAFTLMELLVVIAVIAVLASLLLPTLSRARSSAWSARCKNNLRQLAIGLALYTGEFEVYPFAFEPNRPGQPGVFTWYGLLRPYVQHFPGVDRFAEMFERHRGRANMLFSDGHVEAFKLRPLFLERTDEALRRWNKDHEPHR